MDPTLSALFYGTLALSFRAAIDHHVGLMARQGDNTALDNRLLTGALMNELFAGTLPAQTAGLNTASHAPVPQPWIVPNWANPQGGPPAQTPTGKNG
jgi:hypothetical protein